MRAARGRVKVPEVVFSDCTRSVFRVPVMVLERLPGEPLSRTWPGLDRAARRRMVQHVAAELHELHGLHQEDVPGADFPSPWWTARVQRIEHLLDALHPGPGFPVQWFHTMREYLAVNRHALVESPPPCVLHNDVNWGNVLVADGLITGLIDFDDVLVGPEEEDAWDLVFTCADADPPLDPGELRRIPGLDLAAPGAIERLRICEIENVLELLTGELSWIEPPAAREDARKTYRIAFLSDDYDRLMEMLAP
jgi:aminoglycoside phosphotransferase (APT) family kinase protein